jgi:hypothetical protein
MKPLKHVTEAENNNPEFWDQFDRSMSAKAKNLSQNIAHTKSSLRIAESGLSDHERIRDDALWKVEKLQEVHADTLNNPLLARRAELDEPVVSKKILKEEMTYDKKGPSVQQQLGLTNAELDKEITKIVGNNSQERTAIRKAVTEETKVLNTIARAQDIADRAILDAQITAQSIPFNQALLQRLSNEKAAFDPLLAVWQSEDARTFNDFVDLAQAAKLGSPVLINVKNAPPPPAADVAATARILTALGTHITKMDKNVDPTPPGAVPFEYTATRAGREAGSPGKATPEEAAKNIQKTLDKLGIVVDDTEKPRMPATVDDLAFTKALVEQGLGVPVGEKPIIPPAGETPATAPAPAKPATKTGAKAQRNATPRPAGTSKASKASKAKAEATGPKVVPIPDTGTVPSEAEIQVPGGPATPIIVRQEPTDAPISIEDALARMAAEGGYGGRVPGLDNPSPVVNVVNVPAEPEPGPVRPAAVRRTVVTTEPAAVEEAPTGTPVLNLGITAPTSVDDTLAAVDDLLRGGKAAEVAPESAQPAPVRRTVANIPATADEDVVVLGPQVPRIVPIPATEAVPAAEEAAFLIPGATEEGAIPLIEEAAIPKPATPKATGTAAKATPKATGTAAKATPKATGTAAKATPKAGTPAATGTPRASRKKKTDAATARVTEAMGLGTPVEASDVLITPEGITVAPAAPAEPVYTFPRGGFVRLPAPAEPEAVPVTPAAQFYVGPRGGPVILRPAEPEGPGAGQPPVPPELTGLVPDLSPEPIPEEQYYTTTPQVLTRAPRGGRARRWLVPFGLGLGTGAGLAYGTSQLLPGYGQESGEDFEWQAYPQVEKKIVQPQILRDTDAATADSKLQNSLLRMNRLGYGAAPEDITPEDVYNFQTSAGIKRDGIIGEQTAAALRNVERQISGQGIDFWREPTLPGPQVISTDQLQAQQDLLAAQANLAQSQASRY